MAKLHNVGNEVIWTQKECDNCEQAARLREQKAEKQEQLVQETLATRRRWQSVANIPKLFEAAKFEDFDKKLQAKAFKVMSEYDWQDDVDRVPPSVILMSPNLYGVGKTHLVCALANKILAEEHPAWLTSMLLIQKRRCPVHFTTETSLMDRIRATFKEGSPISDEEIYGQLLAFDVLIIDDVGKVKPRDPSFLQGVYYRIIDGRYTAQRPVIITTNLNGVELEAHIGGACADRLRGMCGNNIITMTGKSYRRG